ncbi:hypothetical protein ANN_18356 [Periplaneta americana]|uniref:Uncharacterized protein n=1 Tax=Periplaneta americana TaxID=6978 RepID=A0ABQ8SPI4_PERAM|nr:hypothetical protein ANN_18356 [Periplaneta americana]
MSPGSSTNSYPAFDHIGLRENPGKNLIQMPPLQQKSRVLHVVTDNKQRTTQKARHIFFNSKANRVLVGRPEGKRPLGRPRRRWEDNIKMDLREVGYDDRDWLNLAQDRDRWRAYVRAAMNLRVP